MSRVALVTGAAGGIGAAVVHALLERGHRVVASDVDADALERLRTTHDRSGDGTQDDVGDRLRLDVMDVTAAEDVERVIEATERAWGPIDWGVNVAGVLEMGDVIETSPEAWQRVFDVNARGVFLVLGALGRRMAERRSGAIVTVGSNAGRIPRAGMGAYAASKAAASMITRTLGLELARSGVRCNVVAAGSTRTPMQARFQSESGGDEAVIAGSPAAFRLGIPLGRIAEPTDVADAVLFLLSDEARHVTMTELLVDGGASLAP